MYPSVAVVMPCRDEAECLPELLDRIPSGYVPIVVDNGSTDDTAAVARAAGARVVPEPRVGYGFAVHAGIMAAPPGSVVATIDGDGSIDPADLVEMVNVLVRQSNRVDMVVGSRVPTHETYWPWHARLGTDAVVGLLRRRWNVAISDIGPPRVFWRDAMADLGVLDRRSGYPVEVCVRAARAGWTLVDFPVSYRPRTAGQSKVTGSLTGSARAAMGFGRAVLR